VPYPRAFPSAARFTPVAVAVLGLPASARAAQPLLLPLSPRVASSTELRTAAVPRACRRLLLLVLLLVLPSAPLLLLLVLLVLVPCALASLLLEDTQTPGLLPSGRARECVHAARGWGGSSAEMRAACAARGWGGSSAEMGGTARAAGGRASTPLVAGSSCIPSHDAWSDLRPGKELRIKWAWWQSAQTWQVRWHSVQ